MKKKIILTFDYEMFFGKTGSITSCLISPTNKIIEVLKKYDVRATFFIDTTFLSKLLENNLIEEYNTIERQLIEILYLGHRLELHIHPHWLDAKYDKQKGNWIFTNYDRYILTACEHKVQKRLFREGVLLLREISRKAGVDYYTPIAYRAGGWCFAMTDGMKAILEENSIKIDSSIIPRRKCVNSISAYDYSSIKYDQPYRFNNSIYEPSEDGNYYEFPIAIYKVSPIIKSKALINRIRNKSNLKRFGDGSSIFDIQKRSLKDRILYNITWSYAYFSTDASCDGLYNRVKNYKGSYLTIVGHPKCTTESSLIFLDTISRDSSLQLCTFYDLYKTI